MWLGSLKLEAPISLSAQSREKPIGSRIKYPPAQPGQCKLIAIDASFELLLDCVFNSPFLPHYGPQLIGILSRPKVLAGIILLFTTVGPGYIPVAFEI